MYVHTTKETVCNVTHITTQAVCNVIFFYNPASWRSYLYWFSNLLRVCRGRRGEAILAELLKARCGFSILRSVFSLEPQCRQRTLKTFISPQICSINVSSKLDSQPVTFCLMIFSFFRLHVHRSNSGICAWIPAPW